jgi:hypothetical protein
MLASAAVALQQEQTEFVLKPPYAPSPELTVKDGVPKGTIHEFVMKSGESKIYPGISSTPYERPVAVYVPKQYEPGTAAPFIIVQDGASPKYRNTIPVVLDNLIHEKRVPAMNCDHGASWRRRRARQRTRPRIRHRVRPLHDVHRAGSPAARFT